MSRKIHLGWMLGIVLCFGLFAEAGKASLDSECGQKIKTRDVLVLDLEPLRGRPVLAEDFVVERAGEYRLIATEPEEIRMRSRPSKDPDSVTRRARKLGAENGCDLVLVLKTGPYLGRQRGTRARIKEHGYVFVVMGQRIAGSKTIQ